MARQSIVLGPVGVVKTFLAILQFCFVNIQIQTITISLCIYSDLPYLYKYKEKQLYDAHIFFSFECQVSKMAILKLANRSKMIDKYWPIWDGNTSECWLL